MKLSEAIREGSKQGGQHFGSLYLETPAGEIKSCAIGAALLAMGEEPKTTAWTIWDRAPITKEVVVAPGCQDCAGGMTATGVPDGFIYLSQLIVHWNDCLKLSREEIADKVAVYEEHFDKLLVDETVAAMKEAVKPVTHPLSIQETDSLFLVGCDPNELMENKPIYLKDLEVGRKVT